MTAGVLRLSYFQVFGLVEKSTYRGMALDNNGILLTFVFLFEALVSPSFFAMALYGLLLVTAGLNVAPINTPKLTGGWFISLIVYSVISTAVYSWQLAMWVG